MLPRTLGGQTITAAATAGRTESLHLLFERFYSDRQDTGRGCVNGPGHRLSDRFGHENFRAQLNDDS